MGIIGWIILGLLAGIIAKAILPGDDPGGIIVTTLIGIAGAFIGGLITKALGFGDPIDEFFDLSTWLGAIIGSIVLLLIYRMVVGRGRSRTAYCRPLPPPAAGEPRGPLPWPRRTKRPARPRARRQARRRVRS
jgi:uncharacterized membrane protein YeaQ/YmgE (transglycosylase-associated protein family)